MSLTLLQLIDRASGELGLDQPGSVIGSPVKQTTHLLTLAQRLGLDLVREYEWQRLSKQYMFQTDAALDATGDTTEDDTLLSNLSVATSELVMGMIVSGSGIPVNTEVLSAPSTSSIIMTQPASASGSGLDLQFLTQDYALPADFDRMISSAFWDRTNLAPAGNLSAQGWQARQAQAISSTAPQFRLYGNAIRISPAPTTVTLLSYEYVSNYWVIAPGTTAPTRSAFVADTDVCVFPDDLMLAGIKFYFLRAKKLDYGDEREEYAEILQTRKAQDQPSGPTSLTGRMASELPVNIPEGDWNL